MATVPRAAQDTERPRHRHLLGGCRDRPDRSSEGRARLGLSVVVALILGGAGTAFWLQRERPQERADAAASALPIEAHTEPESELESEPVRAPAPEEDPDSTYAPYRAQGLINLLGRYPTSQDLHVRVRSELLALDAKLQATEQDVASEYAFVLLGTKVATDHRDALPVDWTRAHTFAKAAERSLPRDPGQWAWSKTMHAAALEQDGNWPELVALASSLVRNETLTVEARIQFGNQLAGAHLGLGALGAADQACADAEQLALADGIDRPGRMASLGLIRATIARLRGLPDHAIADWEFLTHEAERSGEPLILAQLLEERANFYLSSQQHRRLAKHIQGALQDPSVAMFPEIGCALRLTGAVSLAIQSRAQPDLRPTAETELQGVIQDQDTRVSDLETARLRLASVLLQRGATEEAGRQIALVRQGHPGRLQRATEVACALHEAWLARLTATPHDLKAALASAESTFEWFIKELETDPPRKGGQGYLHYGVHRGFLSELTELLLLVHGHELGAELALQRIHRVQAVGSRARLAGYDVVPLSRLQSELLGDEDGLLLYLPAPERSHVFALDAESVTHVNLPGVSSLNAKRKAFHSAFGRGRSPQDWSKEATDLSRWLLPKAALKRAEQWKTVSIVGLDLLRYLPFEELPVSIGHDAGTTLFGDMIQVNYLPSLPTGMLMAQRPSRPLPSRDLTVVAAPTFTEGSFEPIPLGKEQRRALMSGTESSSVRLISGQDVTLQGLRDADLGDSTVLVLLTHGTLDKSRELPTGLALASNSVPSTLWPEDVGTIAPLPPVVIVAACKAARGAGRFGEGGLDSLTGSLLDAGARCILVAHEDLEYEALLRLIEAFQFELLERGLTPAAALQKARATLRRQWPEAHAGAMLHVVGLGHRRY